MSKLRVFIAGLSLTGGIALAWLVLHDYLQGNIDDNFVILCLALLVLGCVQVGGAIGLLYNNLIGVKILMVCYFLQTFAFSLGQFSYLVTSGPAIFLKYDAAYSKIGIDFAIFQVAYHFNISGSFSFFSVNLFALAILILIFRNRDILAITN
jgi:hypothetical protein